jgi:arylsulfatase A-like enzyme
VPFLAAGPGLARGVTGNEPVSIVDMLATVAEACGAAVPSGVPGAEDSRSFHGALKDPGAWRAPRPWLLVERYDVESDDFALRAAPWKLRRLNGVETLIDLARDPREEHPLALDGEVVLQDEARQALERLRTILAHEVPPRAAP